MSVYRTIGPLVFSFKQFFHLISLASISATVFKLCIRNEANQVYYCKQNQGAEIYFFLLFLFFSFLAHLSRRLTGELIGYPWIRLQSVRQSVRPFTFSNVFFSETAWPIKDKFYVEPPWAGGTKVYINGPGHMTKMAATPIYGKNPSKIFSRTGGPIFTKLGM